MSFVGHKALLKASTTAGGAGSYSNVAKVTNMSFKRDRKNLDITAAQENDETNLQGLRGATFDVECVDKTGSDTNGQDAILGYYASNTDADELWLQYLRNGTAGFKFQVRILNVEESQAVDGVAMLKFSFKITGAVTAV